MITCNDINQLHLDGVELLTGETGLNRLVSWTYMVQSRPFREHMNPGNFALVVVDDIRYRITDLPSLMRELGELGVSGMGVSVRDENEFHYPELAAAAIELGMPLFFIRWDGASFVDIAQSIGQLILENEVQNKRTGDYLYNLLFGYEVNEKYIEKLSEQFGISFKRPCRVGIIVIDRTYGPNLEQDEHTYEYYTDCLNRAVLRMKNKPMFMRFLNKFVLLFEQTDKKETELEIETVLQQLDNQPQFKRKIKGTCILGGAYKNPKDFGLSYQEAKSLIPKKDILPNPTGKKVLSASSMGIYKYLFNSGNREEVLSYCNEKLRKLEEYDHANGAFLVETLLEYYMSGFNTGKAAETLFVHRNSMQYRLKKIEEILGMKLEESMEYLDLVNCILIKRLMFS